MKKTGILLLAVTVFAFSCKDNEQKGEAADTPAEETKAPKNEWKVLFDGESLENWKAYNRGEITQWSIENSSLAFKPAEGARNGSENIITKEKFTNFELSLEWKISEGGNSGIMWGVREDEQFDEPYRTGPEIQILDNKRHPDAENGPIRQAGALYDMVPPKEDVTRPAGEWNEMLIKIDHKANLGSVTLNGTKITQFPVHGDQWEALVNKSKFADWEHFGDYSTGHIALQDHNDPVWFRNIKIKVLD